MSFVQLQQLGSTAILVIIVLSLFLFFLSVAALAMILRMSEDVRIMRREKLNDVKKPTPHMLVVASCVLLAILVTIGIYVFGSVMSSYTPTTYTPSKSAITTTK